MGIFDWFSNKKQAAPAAVFDPFDAIAKKISTTGRRWDGSSFNDPYRPPQGYASQRGDLIPRNFGSEVQQEVDGSFRGIAGSELIQDVDGRWRRKHDMRPRRFDDDSHLR
jgi:hypothetical protein